jgi:hypothetical protein
MYGKKEVLDDLNTNFGGSFCKTKTELSELECSVNFFVSNQSAVSSVERVKMDDCEKRKIHF